MSQKAQLRFNAERSGHYTYKAVVTIPNELLEQAFVATIQALQKTTQTRGFARGTTPAEYIAQNFAIQIKNHVKNFCFHYFVIGFLYDSIRKHKLLVAGEPRITTIELDRDNEAHFTFELSTIGTIPLKEWRHLPFKAPRRKRYKDLDRQAEQFLKKEQVALQGVENFEIAIDDWINITIMPVDDEGNPIFPDHPCNVWLKIGNDEIDKDIWTDFLGKHIGNQICTNNDIFQDYFCGQSSIRMQFLITINEIVPSKFFCLDQFKKCFRLKTKKDTLQKLIEVFSYQHDMSQRRAMAEKSIGLLLQRNRFEIPHHIVIRQQEAVIDIVKENPDYYVYRTQKDFQKRIEQLAKKQVIEMLLLDQISYDENIMPAREDICHYLNLTQRPRTKEFVYFNPPNTKVNGQEFPISQEELLHLCCREKTLNYIIYQLTRH